MEVFEIEGGKRLSGRIAVYGSKNATTPILAATLLTHERTLLHNVPRIEDVFRMLEILKSLGMTVEWISERTLSLTPGKIDARKIDESIVKKLRSSILLLGPLSALFPKFSFYQPGGCVIGARPVDTHMDAFAKLGVQIEKDEKSYKVNASRRKAGRVVLREMSVTATENALMLAATLPGKTVIKNAAAEPHVEDLGHFLQKMGAAITGLGTHTIEIVGVKKRKGVEHTIIPDANEAATFLILGVATGSPITVTHTQPEHLDLVLEKLSEFGARFKIVKDAITVVPAKKLVAVAKIDTRFYPGIPTDIQAPLGVLATQAEGETLIFDTLFEGRFNYITELEKMGASATVLNPHQVLIQGATKFHGTVIKSYDLRAGAALIIAALSAQGKTVIEDIYQVDRGYEHIEKRLQKIGAKIKRVERAS